MSRFTLAQDADLAHALSIAYVEMRRYPEAKLRLGQCFWNLYGKPGESFHQLFYAVDKIKITELIYNEHYGVKQNG